MDAEKLEPRWGWDPPKETYQRIPLNKLRHRTEGLTDPIAQMEQQVALAQLPEALHDFFHSLSSVFDDLSKAFDMFAEIGKSIGAGISKGLKPYVSFTRLLTDPKYAHYYYLKSKPLYDLPIAQQQKLRRHKRGPHWRRASSIF